MPYNNQEHGFLGTVMRGCGAVQQVLDCIGAEGIKDGDVAKIIVDDELALRALLTFALTQLAETA